MSQFREGPALGYFRAFKATNGGCVDVHAAHGKLESCQNLPIALFLAARGERVQLLPVHNLQGIKSPDATRDGVEWEFKVPNNQTASAIDNALRSASKQAARLLLHLPPTFGLALLEQALFDRMRRNVRLQEIAVLRGELLHHFTRLEIVSHSFRGRMR